MARYIFLTLLVFAGFSTRAQTHGAVITWEKTTYDFGDLNQGEKVEHTFKFRNTGDEPLVITNVQVTCGCTTPKGWARDPIAPGKSSELTISFNSQGKFGRVNKVVTVLSNATNPEGGQLTFTANVLAKKVPN